MQTTLSDPVAPGLERASLARLVETVDPEHPDPEAVDVRWSGAHSNDVYEVRLREGRRLMLKRGRYDWAEARFRTSGAAARLLAREGIAVPEPLPLPDNLDPQPMQAYWRIPLVTLESLWPELEPGARASAMSSWGRLLDRVHRVRVDGWGGLRNGSAAESRLDLFLERDIGERLLPACRATWPTAEAPLERLLGMAPAIAAETAAAPATLVHNDLHMGNVLCRVVAEDEVQCVGLLDLEAAVAAPPESDAGSLEALHGPLFEQHVSPRWRARVWEGYGRPLDPRAVGFYRALHLANLGFHSALVGHAEHAELVARALHAEIGRLERQEAWT